jgi:hypothetical protein
MVAVVAEADVDQPRPDPQHHVVVRNAETRSRRYTPRGLVTDVVAERPQQCGERAVEFVTEAAPAAAGRLSRDQGWQIVEHDVLARVDAEVLRTGRS